MEANSYMLEQTFSEELFRIKPFRTTVILTKAWHELGYPEKEQLQKISDALKQRINPQLSIDAFQIVHQPVFDINALANRPKEVIYFGPAIKGLSYYELIEANLVKMVLSESLENLISNDIARQKLWKALQQLFSS
jgi:Ser/Thr protein kinase RdoA (MazF antagonist)